MFNSFRKLFGRRAGNGVDSGNGLSQVAPLTGRHLNAPQLRHDLPRAARVDSQPRPVTPPSSAAAHLSLPLKTVLARLPAELMQRIRQLDVGEAEVFIPMQKVLSQIATGSVKLSFGELRQLAPPGTFTAENDRDRTLVELPLQEILIRLNPGYLARRPSQRQVEVPAEVTGPFGGQARIVISTATLKPAAAAQPPATTQTAEIPTIKPDFHPQPPARTQIPIAPLQPIVARVRTAPSFPPQAPQAFTPPATPAE